MKLRFWVGVGLIALAAGLLAYRGRISGYVVEKLEQSKLPRPIPATQFSGGQAPAVAYDEVTEVSKAPTVEDITPTTNEGVVTTRGRANLPQLPVSTALPLPEEFNLAVPFTSQAPYGDWNLPYKEACEEASVAMVDAFYKGRTFNQASATTEILSVVEWENKIFGYYEDTNAEETARILRERYGYANVRVVENPTIDTIKREVAQGRPVILPAAGQLLGNRYFRQPGPVYHMLVVRGWTREGLIITNDPGTKRGEGYLYKPDVLMNAVHDWNGGEVYNGRKAMIVVEK